ncbi:MAG: shikimate dehydrogenase [Wenzhouxiangella sp.]|nr:shikimate dehydrogenase [Wenzhouxiangella sp.]TVR95260.1 MAG: shikimate dehydrogenase [Wenzhouxiangellaceae bacterium]
MTSSLRLAVFGDPISHSLSPRIHGLFGRQLGVEVDYQAIRCGVNELPAKLAELVAGGGIGANLTLPLKQTGLRQCRQLDRAARLARAVNTLKLDEQGWLGFNTDGPGLVLDLERLGIALTDARILILGAGGATAGILAPMLAKKPACITILNRTAERAASLAERFSHLGAISGHGLNASPQAHDLLIQATSLGHSGAMPELAPDWLKPNARVYDLNYGRAHQPVADWAERHGWRVDGGLGMLVGQAALAFEIWTGQRPSFSAAMDSLGAELS